MFIVLHESCTPQVRDSACLQYKGERNCGEIAGKIMFVVGIDLSETRKSSQNVENLGPRTTATEVGDTVVGLSLMNKQIK